MAEETTRAEGVPEKAAEGRCLKCSEVVPLETTFPRVPLNGGIADGAAYHLSREGTDPVCGPVAKALLFHVFGFFGPIPMRHVLRSLRLPSEVGPDLLAEWENHINMATTVRDNKGAMLIGAQRPTFVISSWSLIGREL